MPRMVVAIEHRVKCQLREIRRSTRDKGLAIRCQIILLAAKGRPRGMIAEGTGCSVSWIDRVLARFREFGLAGLIGGGPTFLGGVVGYSFVSPLLSIETVKRSCRPRTNTCWLTAVGPLSPNGCSRPSIPFRIRSAMASVW